MKKCVLGLLSISGVALACTLSVSIVTPLVEVSPTSTRAENWQAIGDKLENWYGNSHINSEVMYRIPTKTCLLGICGTSLETNLYKDCGKTAKQAAYELAESVADTGGGGDDGGGGLDPGGGGYAGGGAFDNCYTKTSTGCATVADGPKNCVVVSELVCPMG